METFKKFVAAMQQVRFDHELVTVRNQQRKVYTYTVEDFWSKVIPAFEKKASGTTGLVLLFLGLFQTSKINLTCKN